MAPPCRSVAVGKRASKLVDQCRDAMPEGGVLTIETANISLDEKAAAAHENLEPGDYAMLGVSDTGGGIESDILKHVFEPFFTTKKFGQGVESGPQHGLRFFQAVRRKRDDRERARQRDGDQNLSAARADAP